MLRIIISAPTAALLLLAAGCTGEVGSLRGGPTGHEPGGPEDPEAPPPVEDDPFALDRESVHLLPFETRMQRVADIAGVGTDDPILAPMREARIALGDYDHSRSILPDDQWTATRMSAWIRVLRPVCTSDAMRARFPAVGDDPSALMAAAWGRDPSTEELADLRAEVSALPEGARAEVACLAVLSSAELVLR